MTTEKEVQDFVHSLEEGVWKHWIRVTIVIVAIVTLSFLMLTRFRGLSTPEGMEQAEIAREIARGNGFSTKMVRPLALWQFQQNKGAWPGATLPDTYHAPLNPWLNSLFLRCDRAKWKLTPAMVQYSCDTLIAEVAVVLFLLSAGINYATAKRLFDARFAVIGMGLILLCNTLWQFALSGLPQMLLLFLFSACLYVLVRGLEARNAERNPALWTALAGVLFGLLALTHGLTIWIFLGALLYVVSAFGWRHALLMAGVFLLLYAPWLVREYRVCGNAGGIAIYSVLDGVGRPGGEWMREVKPTFELVYPAIFVNKLETQFMSQTAGLFGLLGASVMAPLFFLSLFHVFKREVIASLRWGLLLMALGAFAGMCVFGLRDGGDPQANDLYVLFVPMMTYYGLAFFLALWTRLEINYHLARTAVLSVVYVVSAAPLMIGLLRSQPVFRWPPYVPPVIALINTWTNDDEIVSSDMPWAVSWYADRKCLWLPDDVGQFIDISDYARLGSPVVGLLLTPITGDARFKPDIVYGEYRNWARLIMGLQPSKRFPLQYREVLPVNNECAYFSDWPRWKNAKSVPK